MRCIEHLSVFLTMTAFTPHMYRYEWKGSVGPRGILSQVVMLTEKGYLVLISLMFHDSNIFILGYLSLSSLHWW